MDARWTQPVAMDTPLGDELTLLAMSGVEGLSIPFHFEIEALSERSDIDAGALLGASVTVNLDLADQGASVRRWNGLVTRFEYVETGDDGISRYRLTLRPWLWQLSLAGDARIFQNLSVPDIVEQVFRDRGFGDFERRLFDEHDAREYVVQYRESDLDFVSRLLEREGIYYFFRHAGGKHTLVLADDPQAHAPADGYAELPYAADDEHRDQTMQYVRRWRAESRLEAARSALADFDFTKPRARLYSEARSADADGAIADYGYPGGFDTFAGGDRATRLRLEQMRRRSRGWAGRTNARGLAVGCTFDLVGHPREDQNARYLVTSTRLRLRGDDVRSGAPGARPASGEPFSGRFRAIRSDVTFRPPPFGHEPSVRGPQTAVVVGPPEQEIWTDQYGRVKVQFHWDRQGRYDQRSSCWIRVAQAWAGSGWGAQFVPRVGQEVIVDFLEGDPDRPIVTGSVYNGANMPPFELPRSQTQSGVRTRSTPRGTASTRNEIRFDDMLGSEELFIGAERTHTIAVKGDQNTEVLGGQTLHVGGDQAETVRGAHRSFVGGDASITVAGGELHVVSASRRTVTGGLNEERVEGVSQRSVAGDVFDHARGARRVDTLGSLDEHVGGSKTETIRVQSSLSVGGALIVHVEGSSHHSVDGAWTASVGVGSRPASASATVHGDVRVGASGDIVLEAEKRILLQCGDSAIAITPDTLSLLAAAMRLAGKVSLQAAGGSSAMKLADSADTIAPKVNVISRSASLHLDTTATLLGTQVKLGSGEGGSQSSTRDPTDPSTRPFAVKVHDAAGEPLAGKAYVLIAAARRFTGRTGADGGVAARVPKEADSLHLRITLSDGPPPRYASFALSVVDLAPASTREGAVARLVNLGYLTHAQPDAASLRDALWRFQRDRKSDAVPATGELDGPTVSALESAHGH